MAPAVAFSELLIGAVSRVDVNTPRGVQKSSCKVWGNYIRNLIYNILFLCLCFIVYKIPCSTYIRVALCNQKN